MNSATTHLIFMHICIDYCTEASTIAYDFPAYILNGFSLPLEKDPFPLVWPTTPCKTWLLPIFLSPNLIISLYPVGSISQDYTAL